MRFPRSIIIPWRLGSVAIDHRELKTPTMSVRSQKLRWRLQAAPQIPLGLSVRSPYRVDDGGDEGGVHVTSCSCYAAVKRPLRSFGPQDISLVFAGLGARGADGS